MIGTKINTLGYQHAVFHGYDTCNACGFCFFVCPEPGAITVLKDEKEVL
jgi:NAD-dependent dihydropyrimidine dehydrogenase PreA subunit